MSASVFAQVWLFWGFFLHPPPNGQFLAICTDMPQAEKCPGCQLTSKSKVWGRNVITIPVHMRESQVSVGNLHVCKEEPWSSVTFETDNELAIYPALSWSLTLHFQFWGVPEEFQVNHSLLPLSLLHDNTDNLRAVRIRRICHLSAACYNPGNLSATVVCAVISLITAILAATDWTYKAMLGRSIKFITLPKGIEYDLYGLERTSLLGAVRAERRGKN